MSKQKKRSNFENKVLTIRLSLTAVLAASFLLVFFLCGGVLLLFNKIGDVKCFASNSFEVHFIDVGQGDCTFIRFPDDTNILIDTGPLSSASTVVDYLEDLFNQENISHIDYLLLTHQDLDHIGGASKIFSNFQVNCLYRPMVYSTYEVENFGNHENYNVSTSVYYDNVIISAYNEPDCSIRFSYSGISWGNDSYTVTFLSPNNTNYSTSNAYSPIVKITYNNRSFLLTGDAESASENEVISLFPEYLSADVLKVAHHGAKTGTSSQFLAFVNPKIAVISVGAKNSYGHPAEETILRLNQIGCQIYMTSTYGSIAMSVDDDGNIVLGGENNSPTIDLAIIIAVFILAILIVWGVKAKPRKDKKNLKPKKQVKHFKRQR